MYDFRFSVLTFQIRIFNLLVLTSVKVVCGQSEIKRNLSAGRNYAVTGRNFLLAGCRSDPHKFAIHSCPFVSYHSTLNRNDRRPMPLSVFVMFRNSSSCLFITMVMVPSVSFLIGPCQMAFSTNGCSSMVWIVSESVSVSLPFSYSLINFPHTILSLHINLMK